MLLDHFTNNIEIVSTKGPWKITYLSAFRDRGVPKPTSECRCVPQPRWVERVGEREGGKRGGRRWA
jgi:hypothetical protein